MQPLSSALKAALLDIDARVTPRVLVDLYEFYEHDYVPGTDGFDPDDAIESFAAEEITWNGNAYRRELISRGDVTRNFGEKTNTVTLTFSNISRYMATLAQSQAIEGLFLVIRCVVPSVTDDSIVLFAGRCDKPSDIDKKTFSLTARQDFGNINQEIPPRIFAAEDPNGRVPSDPLYEGFRIMPLSGLTPPEKFQVPSTSFFGRLLGKTKTEWRTKQWSSLDNTPYGSVVPMVFGRCQMQAIPLFFADIGFFLIGVWILSEGRIDSISNTTLQDKRFTLVTERDALGDLGGTGTNIYDVNPSDYPEGAIHHGFLSRSAYIVLSVKGSTLEDVDDPPEVTSLIRGVQVSLPDHLGDFTDTGWSDNPVNISRFILTDPRLVNIDPAFMEDAVNYLTGIYCDEPLIDESNSEVSLIPAPDMPQTGVTIRRYPSTGVITPRTIGYYKLGFDPDIIPEEQENDYTSYDSGNIPTTFASNSLLRRRYTFNAPITDHVRAVDFLYKVVFPTFKGFLRINKKGKYEIRSEQSSDATMLRSATAVGDTAVAVNDVLPWKTGPDLLTGRVLLGFGVITSEVRDVSSANYSTTGNSVTLSASASGGGVTATASGANLSGGSTTVQASGTVTIGGTPAAGNTATITINGIASVHTLNADDTTGTAAAMLAARINATPKLHRYIQAIWDSATPTVITIKSKQGVLNLNSALLKAHSGPIADPTSTPSLSSSAGSLGAGTYKVAYTDVTAIGQTALSPIASIGITASKQIDVGAITLVGTSRNWYMSDAPGSDFLKYVGNTNGSAFSINALPLPGAAIPRGYNTTGEELIRIAMSFATNSQDIYPVWRASTPILLTATYLPTVPNGHKYVVSTAGTTGTTEPTWPTTAGATVSSGSAVFTESGSTVLQQSGLTRANIKKDTFKWPLGSRQASVNQIKGKYRDANNDFALTPFTVNDRTHQRQVHKIYPYEVDLSGVDNSHQKDRIANFYLAKFREGDWFDALETGPQGMVLEEGDVICASDDSGGLVNQVTRIEEIRIHANHDVSIAQARKYSTLMFADEVGQDIIPVPTTLRYTQTVDSLVEFIDNFPIRDADGLIPGFYVAVSRDLNDAGDWRGWALYADYGDGYVKIAGGDVPAIEGTATTTLGTVSDPFSGVDHANSVTFTLKFGPPTPFPNPFATVTETELKANSRRNLFLVGDEYVQAATIVDNGDLSYTISDFLRGRFGTDSHQLTHGSSERVVFLDGSAQLIRIDPVRLNSEYNYKVVTTNQDVSDATAIPFTWTGGTIKPFSPGGLKGTRNANLDLLIEWKYRAATSLGMSPNADVPLADEEQRYVIQIYDGPTLKRETRNSTALVAQKADWLPYSGTTYSIVSTAYADYITWTDAGETTTLISKQQFRGDFIFEFPAYSDFLPSVVGIVPVGVNPETDYAAHPHFSNNAGGIQVVRPMGDVSSSYQWNYVSYDRFSIHRTGDVVKFYANYLSPATVPLYETTYSSSRDLVAFASFITGVGAAGGLGPSQLQFKRLYSYNYTKSQQVEDFGSAQSSVKVRVTRLSPIIGPGDYAEKVL